MKAVVSFVFLSVVFAWAAIIVRNSTGRQRWSMIKTLFFGAGCATMSLLVLFIIVILF